MNLKRRLRCQTANTGTVVSLTMKDIWFFFETIPRKMAMFKLCGNENSNHFVELGKEKNA